MILHLLGLLLVTGSLVRAEEICCYDTAVVPPEVGCYHDDFPFDNMPLPSCAEDLGVSMRLYTRDNPDEGQVITSTTIPPVFDPSRLTHFMVHGWLGGRNSPWMQQQKGYLLDDGDYNVIVTGWNEGSRQLWYPQSASDTRVVGTEMALVAKNLVDFGGASYANMYCSGHSLGSHICGHMGQRAGYWGTFGRITGLDPAGPWFENKDHVDIGLDATDASVVDVIHSNGEPGLILNLGTMKPLGHKDFYPNGGGTQPGCILDPFSFVKQQDDQPDTRIDLMPACSHFRAVEYYTESIQGCNFFSDFLCADPYDLPGSCTAMPSPVGSMGYGASNYDTHGIMYLETNKNEPFCLEW